MPRHLFRAVRAAARPAPTRVTERTNSLDVALAAACIILAAPAAAQFDPSRVVVESPAVAAQFPDPDVRYASPGLRPGRRDFPSHAEVLDFLQSLVRPGVAVEIIGASQEGRPMPLVLLTADGRVDPARPTVLILGQQHGNEPAGGEAALALAAELAGPQSALLQRLNVLIVPRANPDGAERFTRTTRSGTDVNRDHLLLRTPEARAIARITARHAPQVVLDLHEFTVANRWVDKFGAVQQVDALLQAATVGNLDRGIAQLAAEGYERRLQQVLADNGLATAPYHTTSPDPKDKVVAMGGVQPDTGRNTGGLRPAVSLLIEVRGVGLGRAHLLRRVHTQVLAALTVLRTAAEQGTQLLAEVRRAGADTAALACRGELVVDAVHTPTRRDLPMLDAVTGAARIVNVEWRAAEPLQVRRTRARPCGYLLAPDTPGLVERLDLLGARWSRVGIAARWAVERYEIVDERSGARQDGRGAIDDGADAQVRQLTVRTVAAAPVVAPGWIYVGLDQPIGALLAAAFEPDSQNSWVANRLMPLDDRALQRVTAPPARQLLQGR